MQRRQKDETFLDLNKAIWIKHANSKDNKERKNSERKRKQKKKEDVKKTRRNISNIFRNNFFTSTRQSG